MATSSRKPPSKYSITLFIIETLTKITKILPEQEAPTPTQPLGWIRPPGRVMDEGRLARALLVRRLD